MGMAKGAGVGNDFALERKEVGFGAHYDYWDGGGGDVYRAGAEAGEFA